ncbi:MAG TPA: acyl-CoA dehydrogenase family protein, partial [Acidimicrobiales bacterium]|nr:acyl-CoA dehydrogenase family protein [Acidimicrobiales bacterium]
PAQGTLSETPRDRGTHMDFEPTDDQLALQAQLRRFLDDRVTPEARRAIADLPGAVDRDLWHDLGGMGVFALTLPKSRGGVGLGFADATLLFEELGRAAVPGPLIGTFLAAGLGGNIGADISGRAATGDAVVGLVPARPVFVDHVAALDALLVVADEGVTLTGRPAGSRRVDRPLDPLTPVDVVEALPAGHAVGGPDDAARLRTVGGLLAAALQVGLADAAVTLATDYAKDRTQFGRAIGSFQAIKHLLADAQVGLEVARAAVQAAGVEIDEAAEDTGGDEGGAAGGTDDGGAPAAGDGDDLAGDDAAGHRACRAVDAARIVASRAADRATRACIQVHGGMGFTWALDAHLFLKRALVLDVGVGSPDESLEALAAAL